MAEENPVGDSPAASAAQSRTFATPSSMLRQRSVPLSEVDFEQNEALAAIRSFLHLRISYDVLPLSYRLIMLDTAVPIKKSINILIQQGIVSAPLWESHESSFAGLLTVEDYLNVIQYYWQRPEAVDQIDKLRLSNLRDIEKDIGVRTIETVAIHPDKPIHEACRRMLRSRARRIPLVDFDDETDRLMVVSVITQYRILKFVAVNVQQVQQLKKPLKDMTIGTWSNFATAMMETPVIDLIHVLVKRNISCIPILNADGVVINVFESVDVLPLLKNGNYDDLNLNVGEALLRRPADFPGIYFCSPNDRLDGIFDTIRRSRVHRFIILDNGGKLAGILGLSDILGYLLYGQETGSPTPESKRSTMVDEDA